MDKLILEKADALDWLQEFLMASNNSHRNKLHPLYGGHISGSIYSPITIEASWHVPLCVPGPGLSAKFVGKDLFKLVQLMQKENRKNIKVIKELTKKWKNKEA